MTTILPSHLQVCKDDKTDRHFLRVHLHTHLTGTLRFESERAFTKREADFRAMLLSSQLGFTCDELPTHPSIAAYPPVVRDL